MATGEIKAGSPVELLAKTACGLSSNQTIGDLKTIALSDDISNYRLIQVIMYTTTQSVERELFTLVIVPTYDGGDVITAIFSDSNTSYYCYGLVKLNGSSLIIRRAYYNNYSAPSFRVIGIP